MVVCEEFEFGEVDWSFLVAFEVASLVSAEAEILFSVGLTVEFLDVCQLNERSEATGGGVTALLVSGSSTGGGPETTEGLDRSLGLLGLSSDLGGRETM